MKRAPGFAVVVVVAALAWPGVARAQVDRGAEHQRRAASLLARGQHAPAGDELLEAFWATRNTNFLLGAAQAYEAGGRGADAAAMYFLYLNLAPLDPSRRDAIRARMIGISQAPAVPAPARPATPAPTTPAPTPVAPALPRTELTPIDPTAEEPATTVAAVDPGGPPPETRPEPRPVKRPKPRPKRRGPVMAGPRNPGFLGPEDTSPPQTRTQWYGAPMLVSETVSIALVVGGLEGDNDTATTIGVLGMIFAPPIIHGANGRGLGAAFGGWGLRLLGMLLFSGADDPEMLLVGYSLGAAVDILFVAKKEVPVRPTVSLIGGGSTVGVAWSF